MFVSVCVTVYTSIHFVSSVNKSDNSIEFVY
nr:MAG TPA: hypothetical protein [Caudoviricetes sp.]